MLYRVIGETLSELDQIIWRDYQTTAGVHTCQRHIEARFLAVVVVVRLVILEVVRRVACDVNVNFKLLSQEVDILFARHVLYDSAQYTVAEIRVNVVFTYRFRQFCLCQNSLDEQAVLTVLACEHRVLLPCRGRPRSNLVLE